MDSKKLGFTLAEILGVIVIIGILLILIVPTVINRLNSTSEEVDEATDDIIYNAADQYIREHPSDYPPGKAGRYCITIQSLVDDGKLSSPVKDATTGEDITDKSVMVTIYSAGTSDFEIRDGAECKEMASLPMIDFLADPKGSSWVKKRTITIIYPSVDGNFEARHRIDNGAWVSDSSANKGGNIKIEFTKISKLEAQLKGNQIISGKFNVVNVDSEIPVVTKVVMGKWVNHVNRVEITAKDNISGISGLYISTSSAKPNENASGWISVSSNPGEIKKFTRDLDLGTYYVWVKDKAGNVSNASNNVITVKDTTPPTCSISDSGKKGSNNWYTGNVTLKMTTNDNESGVKSYGMNTSGAVSYNGTLTMTLSSDTKTITYTGYVQDRGGNTAKCTKTVKRDASPPTISFGISNIHTAKVNCSDSISGASSYTSSLSGSSNYTLNGKCTNGAGLTSTGSHTYRYSSCAAGENTCRYGCDTCSECRGGYVSVWSNCARYGYQCVGCTQETCPFKTNPATCKMMDGYYSKPSSSGYPWCCRQAYNSCCSTKRYCIGGYVSKWSNCATTVTVSCRCSSCYTGHNTCQAGFLY